VVRTFDAPEAMGVRFHEVEAKSAINRVPGEALPFSWTVNPYRGCSHACTYCFARPTHRYLDLNSREDFEREIVVKVNVPERLRAELARPSWKGEMIALGTNTDPYQWVEGRYKLTRAVWEVMLEARNPASVLTKSPLLTRDIDLFKRIDEVASFQASLSIPTLDEAAWRATEPRTPHPRKRIEAVAELKEAGIPVGVLVAPLMPGINDSPQQVERILELCAQAGADSVGGIGLHLKGEVREIFLDWLRSQRPDLVDRYEELYARGAFLPGSERTRINRMLAEGLSKANLKGSDFRERMKRERAKRRQVARVDHVAPGARRAGRRASSGSDLAEVDELSPQASLF
jgi:DNA repair photolyase